MEKTRPWKNDNYRPQDEASYYLGDNFELGGVKYDEDFTGMGPQGGRSDQNIFHEVCELLADNPRLDATGIEVEVSDGRVYLRGTVAGRWDKCLAERCVEGVRGVQDVMNELRFDY